MGFEWAYFGGRLCVSLIARCGDIERVAGPTLKRENDTVGNEG